MRHYAPARSRASVRPALRKLRTRRTLCPLRAGSSSRLETGRGCGQRVSGQNDQIALRVKANVRTLFPFSSPAASAVRTEPGRPGDPPACTSVRSFGDNLRTTREIGRFVTQSFAGGSLPVFAKWLRMHVDTGDSLHIATSHRHMISS